MDNQRLRELRMEAGKTQAEVAAFLGCHREVYRRYETGSSPAPVLSQQRHPY